MSEFMFIAKVLALTIVTVAVLQLEWDGQTLERHVESGVIAGSVTPYLQGVARGGAKLLLEGRDKVVQLWHKQVPSSNAPEVSSPVQAAKKKIEKLEDDLYED